MGKLFSDIHAELRFGDERLKRTQTTLSTGAVAKLSTRTSRHSFLVRTRRVLDTSERERNDITSPPTLFFAFRIFQCFLHETHVLNRRLFGRNQTLVA